MAAVKTLLRERYALGRRLGRGAFATTDVATDTRTGQEVVVKQFSLHELAAAGPDANVVGAIGGGGALDRAKAIDLFEREAKVLANLEHPGIPKLVDSFTLDQGDGDVRLCLVQELVPGQDLARLVEDGRHFTEAEAARIGGDLAEILTYLHGRSPPLVHRDVKPTNVLLTPEGGVVLVDFGSVKTDLARVGRIADATVVGTFGYMPVEQFEGAAVPRSDVYALGATLVSILSHQDPATLPRSGRRIDFRAHVQVSVAFAEVLDAMLAPAAAERPSAREAARAFRDLLAGRPPTLHRRGASRQARVMVATLGALVAMGGAVGALSFMRHGDRQQRAAVQRPAAGTRTLSTRTTTDPCQRNPRSIEEAASVDELARALGAGAMCRVSSLTINPKGVWAGVDAGRALELLARQPAAADLRRLRLRQVDLTAAMATALADASQMAGLTDLELDHARAEPGALTTVMHSPHRARLRTLRAWEAGLTDDDVRGIAAATHARALVSIKLQGNRIGDEGAEALAGAAHLSGLETLDLGGNALGPRGAVAIARSPHLRGLRQLILISNGIGDEGAVALAGSENLAGLTRLALGGTGIGDRGAQALARSPHLSRLQEFTLDNNVIGADGALAFAAEGILPAMTRFSLSGNRIPGATAGVVQHRYGPRVVVTRQRP